MATRLVEYRNFDYTRPSTSSRPLVFVSNKAPLKASEVPPVHRTSLILSNEDVTFTDPLLTTSPEVRYVNDEDPSEGVLARVVDLRKAGLYYFDISVEVAGAFIDIESLPSPHPTPLAEVTIGTEMVVVTLQPREPLTFNGTSGHYGYDFLQRVHIDDMPIEVKLVDEFFHREVFTVRINRFE